MNVLFVTYDFPYPTNSGGKNRAYHLLKYTAKRTNVFLYSFVRRDYNPEHNNEILSLGVKDIKVFKRRKLASLSNIPKTILSNQSIFKTLYFDNKVLKDIQEYIKREKIDVIHFESSYTGYYIGPELKRSGVKTVLGTENIEFKLYSDYAKKHKKIFLRPFIKYQAEKLKSEELYMVKNADKVITITQSEADIIKELTDVKSYIVANGIEPKTYSFKFDDKIKRNILFVGNFSYFPNIDAINFFYNEVFRKLADNITLTIIGNKCSEKFKFDDKRVIIKDFVEDIISEYRKADLLVFPIRIGGGTNFKVLEAMSLGIPIVAQPERLSGLSAIEGEHFLRALNANDYIEQIDKLYSDSKLRKRLAVSARTLIDKYYAWEAIGRDLFKVWKNV